MEYEVVELWIFRGKMWFLRIWEKMWMLKEIWLFYCNFQTLWPSKLQKCIIELFVLSFLCNFLKVVTWNTKNTDITVTQYLAKPIMKKSIIGTNPPWFSDTKNFLWSWITKDKFVDLADTDLPLKITDPELEPLYPIMGFWCVVDQITFGKDPKIQLLAEK